MKVAFDTGILGLGDAVRGRGVYTNELFGALNDYEDTHDNFKLDIFDFSKNSEKLKSGKYDILHYSNFFPYSVTLPASHHTKNVITIHDLIQLVYPQKYKPGFKGKISFLIQKLRLKNIDGILTVSETSKKDIIRFLPFSSEKVEAVYLAPKKVFKEINDRSLLKSVAEKYSLPSKFVLYVGDVNYNKNIPTLLKAVRIAGIPLVICGKHALNVEHGGFDMASFTGPRDWIRYVSGKPHPELEHFKNLLEEFTDNKKIIRTGFIPDEDLAAIYNLATVYCQPSFYEGFGLSILESFACGTPVIVSKTQALMEIAGNTSLSFDPNNVNDLVDKILKIFKDTALSVKLSRNGLEKAKEFSWEKTALNTVEFYKFILSGKETEK